MKVDLIAHTVIPYAPDWGTAVDKTPYFDQMDATAADTLVEFAGRSCYQSWKRPNPATATNKGYIANILKQRHFSVLEHASATFYVQGVGRALTHELIRHRHLSYSQLSQRFVNEDREDDLVLPPAARGDEEAERHHEYAHELAHNMYDILVKHYTEKGLPVQPRPEPGYEVRETYEEGEWEAIDMNCAAGEWTLERTNWTRAEYRESSFVWDSNIMWWSEVWGDWMLVESTDEIETKIETFDPAEEPACAEMPPTGAGQVAGLAGIALLTLIGGTFLVRRSKA